MAYSQAYSQTIDYPIKQIQRLPAIVLDIDGVIVKGRSVIGNSPHVIRALLEPYSDNRVNIPFVLMTNGGGLPEPEKAEDINSRIGLPMSHCENRLKLQDEHMILCHTPLRDPSMLERYRDKHVIVTGRYEELHVAQFYGYHKAIHVEELAVFFGDEIPNDLPVLGQDKLAQYRNNLESRFGKTIDQLEKELCIAAIFVIFGVTFSSLTIQILSDIIGSKTGHPKGPRRQIKHDGIVEPQAVQFFCTNNDLVWPNTFPVPRYGTKMFTLAMQAVFQGYYGYPIDITYFGKPQKATFDFCEKLLRERAAAQGVEISHFYMIGDTPDSDIQGANNKASDGWVSVLVRSGLFDGPENSSEHPAQHVVEDVEEAVKMIFQLEGVERDIMCSMEQ